ncbi:hypothetical protein K0B04_01085 [Patescibacteria group bacterium]|nr:hypothetical protein [Patescibacteria group bacterium]
MKKSLMFVLCIFMSLLMAILLAIVFGLTGYGVISIADSLFFGHNIKTLDISIVLGYIIFGFIFEYFSYPRKKIQSIRAIVIWPFFLYLLLEEGLEKALKQM